MPVRRDRYECQSAAAHTGYDPTQAGAGVSPEVAAGKRADYFRDEAARLALYEILLALIPGSISGIAGRGDYMLARQRAGRSVRKWVRGSVSAPMDFG